MLINFPSISLRTVTLFLAVGLLVSLVPEHVAQGQTKSKNRRDERMENERVEKARKELSQTKSEIEKLQTELNQKSRVYTLARGSFLRLKKKSDEAMEAAEERVGAPLGIPEQMKAFREASIRYQEKINGLIEKLKQDEDYSSVVLRLQECEELLDKGVQPKDGSPMTASEIDDLENAIAIDRKKLQSIEDKAIAADSEATEAKGQRDRKHVELQALRSKLNGKEVANDPKYKAAKAESDKALKKMQESLSALKKAESNLQKKMLEHGLDYKSYQKARQADASDRNQENRKKAK